MLRRQAESYKSTRQFISSPQRGYDRVKIYKGAETQAEETGIQKTVLSFPWDKRKESQSQNGGISLSTANAKDSTVAARK